MDPEILNWWWTLDVTEKAYLCASIGGSLGDALNNYPPDYVIEWVYEQNEVEQ